MSRQRGAWEDIGDETWDRGVRRKSLGLLKDLIKVDLVLKQMLSFMIHEAICTHHRLLKG